MRCDWFSFKGIDCRAYGIRVSDRPPIMFPQERVSFTNVPGRSGSLSVTEGENIYNDMVFSFKCVMKDSTRVNEIAAWLRGSGELVVPYRQGGFYKARYTGQLNLAQVVKGRENVSFSVEFLVHPFFYLNSGLVTTQFTSSYTLSTIGNISAEPIITFTTMSHDVVITVGDNAMTVSKDVGVGERVIIDCENKMVYTEERNLCSFAMGTFPSIDVSEDTVTISVSGHNTTIGVTVTPNWRML